MALDLDGEVLAQVLLEAAQGQVAAQDQGGVGAQAVEDAGELEADIAGTHHGQAAGQGVDVLEHLVGGDGELDARDLGQGRPGADGDQHAGGGDLEPAGLDHEARRRRGAAGGGHGSGTGATPARSSICR